jgi:hypothetical protein
VPAAVHVFWLALVSASVPQMRGQILVRALMAGGMVPVAAVRCIYGAPAPLVEKEPAGCFHDIIVDIVPDVEII